LPHISPFLLLLTISRIFGKYEVEYHSENAVTKLPLNHGGRY
jgi:hypothetical protein